MSEGTRFVVDDLSFDLPEGWHEHTEGSTDGKEFAINTQAGSARLAVRAVDPSQAMPYDQDQQVASIIHQQSIDDKSGLIEVATINNGDFHSVHSLFKRQVNDPDNPMLKLFYSASLYVHTPSGKAYGFQFQGREEGMTGMRDAQVLAQTTKGFLMNQSEKAEYDNSFPNHPLSLLRNAIKAVSNSVHGDQ
jgi:hypothetical protein